MADIVWGIPATGVLAETLLDGGTDADVAEAAIERLAVAPADDCLTVREIWLLRLRAPLARVRGDMVAYADLRDRYEDARPRESETVRNSEFGLAGSATKQIGPARTA
jgi:hypothetical protein